jgi:hypothetical protein
MNAVTLQCGMVKEREIAEKNPLRASLEEVRASLLMDAERLTSIRFTLPAYPQPQILFYLDGSVRGGQLKVPLNEVAEEKLGDAVVFLLCFLRCVDDDDQRQVCVTGYYIRTEQDWREAKVQGKMKIMRLDAPIVPGHAPTIATTVSPPPQQQHAVVVVRTDEVNIAESVCDMDVEATPMLVWLQSPGKNECSDMERMHYVSFLCDYILMQRHNQTTNVHDTERKWQCYMRERLPFTRNASFFFLLACAKAKLATTHDLLSHWLAFEKYLCRCCCCAVLLNVDAFEKEVSSHLNLMDSFLLVTQNWQHSRWHSLTLDGTGVMWRRATGEEDRYEVRALWLLHEELGPLRSMVRVNAGGMLSLDSVQFQSQFLPCLYGLLCQDIFCLARHLAINQFSYPSQYRAFFPLSYPTESELVAPLIVADGLDSDALFHYNYLVLEQTSSPVYRAMLAHYQAREERRWKNGEQAMLRLSDVLVDIEDLLRDDARLLPPCLTRLLAPLHRKNSDRLAAVGYLVDSGYTDAAKILAVLCRGGEANTGHNRKELLTLIHSSLAKKRARLSPSCARIINSLYEKGNILRCPYEEAENGPRRRTNHNTEEIKKFRDRCACSITTTTTTTTTTKTVAVINHPLDYVSHKLAAL